MDPMVSLNIVTLVMASISLALSSLSALPHVKGLADLLKRWFLRMRDAAAGVMAVVGVVTLAVVGVNFLTQQVTPREHGVSNGDAVIASGLRKCESNVTEMPAARRETAERTFRKVGLLPDSRE